MAPPTAGSGSDMSIIAESRKAIAAGFAAGGAALTAAVTDGVITGTEWVVIVAAALVGGTGIWLIPNQIPDAIAGQHAAPDQED